MTALMKIQFVNTSKTGKVSEEKLKKLVLQNFDLTPRGIMRDLKLRRPIYKKTACYGHFGRTDEDFTWEALDKVPVLKKGAQHG